MTPSQPRVLPSPGPAFNLQIRWSLCSQNHRGFGDEITSSDHSGSCSSLFVHPLEKKRLLDVRPVLTTSSPPRLQPAHQVSHCLPPQVPGWNHCTVASPFAERRSRQGRRPTAAKAACFPTGQKWSRLAFLQARRFPCFFSSGCGLTPSTRWACVELAEKHPGRGAVYKYYKKSKARVFLRLLSNMLSKRYIKVCRHFVN